MEDILNSFGIFYDNVKNNDIEKMDQILNEIRKYDVYDFISRVSSLRLIPENQGKAVILDCLIACALTLNKEDINSNIIMSSGKFRSIICRVEELHIKLAEDPPENMFIERVIFNDNYYIFQGINYLPSYTLQVLIYILFKNENNIDKTLISEIGKLINTILNISNEIAHQLNYNYENIKAAKQSSKIVIPDRTKLDKIKELLTIDKDVFEKFLGDNEYLNENIYTTFGLEGLKDTLDFNNKKYFESPFLVTKDNKVIILDITILASFTVHHSIIMAKNRGELEKIIELYNEYIWQDCKKSMKKLGHNKIVESNLGITLYKDKSYREEILNVANDKLIILTGIFDNGTNYNKGDMFTSYNNVKLNTTFRDRNKYLYEKLSKCGVDIKNIFECIIIWSFGREIKLYCGGNLQNYFLGLNPYELKCISINERSSNLFLPRYIMCKSKLIDTEVMNIFSELNFIELYVNNDRSFYIDDDFNPRKHSLYLDAGESVNYMIKAAQKENRHLIDSYQDGYKSEVILSSNTSRIYCDDSCNGKRVSLYIEFEEIGVWVISSEFKNAKQLNICFTMVDLISYWLEQCKNILNSWNYRVSMLNIEVVLTGNINDYSYKKDINKTILDTIKMSICNNSIKIYITEETYQLLDCFDNSNEKQLIKFIIEGIEKYVNNSLEYDKEINEIFNIKFKKKVFSLDYEKYPYFKPFIYDKDIRKIQAADENELLDEIGISLIQNQKLSYGVVDIEERVNITRYVVDYLYKKLEDIIKELDSTNLIELVYYDCEKVLYNLLLESKRYGIDIACYPENAEKILNKHNETNKSSVALKFLIEYLAAVQPSGKKIIGELEYEQLLAMCSLIIEWAYKGDLFKFNIYNTPIEILKSDRIGMKREEFTKTNMKTQESRAKMLEYNSLYDFKDKESKEENLLFDKYNKDLEDAFIDEYGFSLKMLIDIIWNIIYIGEGQESEIKKFSKKDIIKVISNNIPEYSSEIVKRVIEYLSLEKREEFLEPPSGYRREDIYPWRFNRELSFTRKPIINRGGELIWGNRCLFHVIGFILDLIKNGKYKAKKKKLKEVIGKISNDRGEQFNNLVYNKIKNYNKFKVCKNVKKINRKLIADELGNALGDIDVLFINESTKTIVLIETKDFCFSKNPYEMYNEYQNMFVNKGNKKCYSLKHHRRAKWFEENIKDVLQEFKLNEGMWKIKPIFIVSEYIISNFVYDKGEKIISITELNENQLLKI